MTIYFVFSCHVETVCYLSKRSEAKRLINVQVDMIERENNQKAKSADRKQPVCPEEKGKATEDAMRHFQMI